MTRYGKLNLAAMLLLPVAATLAALIVFGPLSDTLLAVFGINLIPMLIGGLVAGLLIRSANRKAGGRGAAIGLWPSAIPAVVSSACYLWYAVRPSADAPGFEYVAVPMYTVIGVLALCVVAAIGVRLARNG